MFVEYESYLEKINADLKTLFEEQEPYVFCKEGCCKCCLAGQFPMSELEFEFLYYGFKNLGASEHKIIKNRIKKLKKDYQKSKTEKFEHSCPFLIGSSCSLYEYRPLICRTFGLIKSVKTSDGVEYALLPECVNEGLNYSNVYNVSDKSFNEDKISQISPFIRPQAYDISLGRLLQETSDININFGEAKCMMEHLVCSSDF